MRRLAAAVSGLLAASLVAAGCGLPPEGSDGVPGDEIGSVGQESRQSQGRQSQGRQSQGTELDDLAIKGFRLSSLRKSFPFERSWGPADKTELIEGQLVVSRSLISGDTASLHSCFTTRTGLTRNCGWQSAGVGQ